MEQKWRKIVLVKNFEHWTRQSSCMLVTLYMLFLHGGERFTCVSLVDFFNTYWYKLSKSMPQSSTLSSIVALLFQDMEFLYNWPN